MIIKPNKILMEVFWYKSMHMSFLHPIIFYIGGQSQYLTKNLCQGSKHMFLKTGGGSIFYVTQ